MFQIRIKKKKTKLSGKLANVTVDSRSLLADSRCGSRHGNSASGDHLSVLPPLLFTPYSFRKDSSKMRIKTDGSAGR